MKGFCVITDQDDIVVSISMIPGLEVPECFNVYFPAADNAQMGEVYKEN